MSVDSNCGSQHYDRRDAIVTLPEPANSFHPL
jgi:hypothetical protein